MSHWDQFPSDPRGTWEKLSQVAVTGAEYDSHERQPHPKCLEGTRVTLLNKMYELLDDQEKSRIVWLNGTAGVGKSAVAFTVAERMRGLRLGETKAKRPASSFFFSREHTKRCTTGYFFATLVYQLAINFPSVREDVNSAIGEDPDLLDPDKSLREQMEALFLKPLWKLRFRLPRNKNGSDSYNNPRDRLRLMLELTSELLPGTEVYRLYDCILETCTNPMQVYVHLSIIAALADPLPMSQISTLLDPSQGWDVKIALQLRSVMDIPIDGSLPALSRTIYHTSPLPTSYSSLRLMIQDIPNGTALLDALKKLEGHSQAMKPHEPQCLKRTLSFIVEPPEPLHVLMRDVDHSSSSLSQGRFLPDTEIIRAMTAFVIFANETRERSQSASDALKYACQHWVFHLSRAPGQWDDMLNCVFKVAWDRHLLSWLEMQWNLKGLCHCLDVLSELKGRNLQRYFQ